VDAGNRQGDLMAEPPQVTKPLWLSASKIDTFQNCSALYSAKYLWRLPDPSNDGARRGSAVHDVLEILLRPRHRRIYDAAIEAGTCQKVPALWRVVERKARKYQVADDENIEMIDAFIMVALKHEFHGPKGTTEIVGEKPFEISVNMGGKRYNVRGKIDRTATVKDKTGVVIWVRDYKSSKEKFKGEKLTYNIQSLMYQLALRHLYPQIKRRNFDFLFVKFPREPIQTQPSFTDLELDGFEWILTELQSSMESFTMDNALDNAAAGDPERGWLCGKEGKKKNGQPNWICGMRLPRDYWVLLEGGEIQESWDNEPAITPKPGQTLEKRYYSGCPAHFNSRGQRRNFS
jgi:ATP-dependent helicase/DNAse subunit B